MTVPSHVRQTDEVIAFYGVLGRNIAEARRGARLTQDVLARAVGLSRTSITNAEKGAQQLPLHTLLALCDALGTSLPALLEGTPAGGAVQASAAARSAQLTARALERIEQVRRDARRLDVELGGLFEDIVRPAVERAVDEALTAERGQGADQ